MACTCLYVYDIDIFLNGIPVSTRFFAVAYPMHCMQLNYYVYSQTNWESTDIACSAVTGT